MTGAALGRAAGRFLDRVAGVGDVPAGPTDRVAARGGDQHSE